MTVKDLTARGMTKIDQRIQMPFHPVLLKYRDACWKIIGAAPKSGPMFTFKMLDLAQRFNYAILLVKARLNSCEDPIHRGTVWQLILIVRQNGHLIM